MRLQRRWQHNHQHSHECGYSAVCNTATWAGHGLLFGDRAAPEIFQPAIALSHGLDEAQHAICLVEDLIAPQRVLPAHDGSDEVERVVKAGVAEVDVELFPPRPRVLRGDA